MSRRLHAVPNAVAEDLAAQAAALDIPCPRCGAGRDAYCHNTETGDLFRGRISHWQRLAAAARTEDQT